MSPPVPYKPMSATEHRNRWDAATVKVWYLPGALADRPGLHEEHVFDFHDGLRLIISTDNVEPFGTVLHVSASVRPRSPLYDRMLKSKIDLDAFHKVVQERVRFIGGVEVHFDFFSDKDIPHYFNPPLVEAEHGR